MCTMTSELNAGLNWIEFQLKRPDLRPLGAIKGQIYIAKCRVYDL